MIWCIKDSKISTKEQVQLVNIFSKEAGHKNQCKWLCPLVAFIYTIDIWAEKEFMETELSIIDTNNIKKSWRNFKKASQRSVWQELQVTVERTQGIYKRVKRFPMFMDW